MAKNIFITGASSGIGKACAKYFAEKGWGVAATMRRPEVEKELNGIDGIKLFKLDVTDEATIERSVRKAIDHFGKIDVVLNNAGYGTAGPFEAATSAQIKRQFDTNLFGLMDVTRAFLPHFRENQDGLFMNVSSIGGLITFPTFSLYHATKWALEGFSESLSYEVAHFGVRVKIIEPGGVKTDFASRSLDMLTDDKLTEVYKPVTDSIMKVFSDTSRADNYSTSEQLAEMIFAAATDESDTMRYLCGKDAEGLWELRKQAGDDGFRAAIRQQMLG